MGQDAVRHGHPNAVQWLLRLARPESCPHANACLTGTGSSPAAACVGFLAAMPAGGGDRPHPPPGLRSA